jgi:hypothetical protein
MAIKALMLKKLRARDPYCWHCGETNDLVPHHRRNKGMGGSKIANTYDNLMMVCALYNGAMESDWEVARYARAWGRKIASWDALNKPVFDTVAWAWYVLDSDGGKREIDVKDYV